MGKYKAFIRVVKSLKSGYDYSFGSQNIVEERLIEAEDKNEVKEILKYKYPQFFQNGKVYEKETKDEAQFFYVVIYPLYDYEINQINEGSWVCDSCGHKHENKYLSRPYTVDRLFAGKQFCSSEGQICLENYKREIYKDIELPDDEIYVKKDSPNYIYKITEKSTGKCYVGKTRNAPFFRWCNHLTHSGSPFGIYLRSKPLSDFTFEILEILPPETKDVDVFDIETKYIIEYDSIKNGFNSVISKKQISDSLTNQLKLIIQEDLNK